MCSLQSSVISYELKLYFRRPFCFRIDDCKDKIRGVLKGRLPPDKDLKKEMTQALRSFYVMYLCVNDYKRGIVIAIL